MPQACPAHLSDALEGLALILERPVQFETAQAVSGGCINRCHAVDTDAGRFFLKQQDRPYAGFFAAEAAGLKLLGGSAAARVPKVLGFEDRNAGNSWLWLEWLDAAPAESDADAAFGRHLAQLHARRAERFGRPGECGPFYLATLEQDNRALHRSWPDFFRAQRMPPLLQACGKTLPLVQRRRLEKLADTLEDRVPAEVPALIHGDLWSGNALTGPDGHTWMVDPAPLYGHRESDLAMMRLFGGFSERFFSAYGEALPLQPGWRERVALFQIEPILVHVALFGSGYVGQLGGLLDRLKV